MSVSSSQRAGKWRSAGINVAINLKCNAQRRFEYGAGKGSLDGSGRAMQATVPMQINANANAAIKIMQCKDKFSQNAVGGRGNAAGGCNQQQQCSGAGLLGAGGWLLLVWHKCNAGDAICSSGSNTAASVSSKNAGG